MRKSVGVASVTCVLALGALLGAHVAGAQLVAVSTAQLAEEAEAIVRGTVKAKESAWNEERSFIYTFVTLSVAESLKGDDLAGQDIQIRVPGGEVDNIGQRSSDQVDFEVGEESVIFMGKVEYQGKMYYDVPRMVQGKLAVEEGMIAGQSIDSFMQEVSAAVERQMSAKEEGGDDG